VRQLGDFHGYTLQRPRHRAGVKERGALFHFWGPRHLEAQSYYGGVGRQRGGAMNRRRRGGEVMRRQKYVDRNELMTV